MKMPGFPINWIAVLCSGLIPLAIGFVWYSPKVFGKAWMNASGMTEEKAKEANMPLIMGVSLLFSVMLAVAIMPLVVHQMHILSSVMKNPEFGKDGTKLAAYLTEFMKTYGGDFRTFRHGAFHGVIAGLFFVLPVLGTNALFDGKGFKYIAINVGYWTLTIALMGGLICGWSPAGFKF